jgi:hypothetical protein
MAANTGVSPSYLFPIFVWDGGRKDLVGDPLQYGPQEDLEPTGWDERKGFAELQMLEGAPGSEKETAVQIISGANGSEIIGCEGDDSDVIAGLDVRTAALGLGGLGVVYVLYRMMRHPTSGQIVQVPQIVPPGTPGAVPVAAPPPVYTAPPPVVAPAASSTGMLPDTIMNGEKMQLNDVRRSPAGAFTLVMQPDGNLVLYNTKGLSVAQTTPSNPAAWAVTADRAMWATNTNDGQTKFAWMQSDGNFVLYTADMRATWASNTNDGQPNFVTLDDNGLLAMRGPGGAIKKQFTYPVVKSSSTSLAAIAAQVDPKDPQSASKIQQLVKTHLSEIPIKYYTVAPGDTPKNIQNRFGLATLDLSNLNQDGPGDVLANYMGRGAPLFIWGGTAGNKSRIPADATDFGAREGATGTVTVSGLPSFAAGAAFVGNAAVNVVKAPVAFAAGVGSGAFHAVGNVFHTLSSTLKGHRAPHYGQRKRR